MEASSHMQHIMDSPPNAIGYLLQHVAAGLNHQLDQALLERLGIGMSQFKILMALQCWPNAQQKQLAYHLGQTEASISRQIKMLLDKGMLKSEINPKNRREHLTVPTAKGVRLAEAAREVTLQYTAPLFVQIPEKQQRQLVEQLTLMHNWVCPPGKSTSCNHPFNI